MLRATPADIAFDPLELMAEQALLGALLLDATAVAAIASWLHPAHLYRPVHQQLLQVLVDRDRAGHRATEPDASAEDRRDWALGAIDQASASATGFTVNYGHTLIAACPAPASANTYAALVLQSAVRRELMVHTHRLGTAAAAGNLADVWLLLRALERTAARCSTAWSQATAWHAPLPGPGGPATTTEPAAQTADTALAAEQQLIAVLMEHPHSANDLRPPVRAEDFASPLHRLMFSAIADLSQRSLGVDPLTVMWQVRATAPSDPAPDLDQVRQLASQAGAGDPAYWADQVITASVLRTVRAGAEQLHQLAMDPRRSLETVFAEAYRIMPQLHSACARAPTPLPQAPAGPAATGSRAKAAVGDRTRSALPRSVSSTASNTDVTLPGVRPAPEAGSTVRTTPAPIRP